MKHRIVSCWLQKICVKLQLHKMRLGEVFRPYLKRSLNNLDHWIAEDACKCHHENFSNRKSILSRVTAKKKDKRTACDAMFGLTKETPRYSINVRMRVSELAQTRELKVEEFPVRLFFNLLLFAWWKNIYNLNFKLKSKLWLFHKKFGHNFEISLLFTFWE